MVRTCDTKLSPLRVTIVVTTSRVALETEVEVVSLAVLDGGVDEACVLAAEVRSVVVTGATVVPSPVDAGADGAVVDSSSSSEGSCAVVVGVVGVGEDSGGDDGFGRVVSGVGVGVGSSPFSSPSSVVEDGGGSGVVVSGDGAGVVEGSSESSDGDGDGLGRVGLGEGDGMGEPPVPTGTFCRRCSAPSVSATAAADAIDPMTATSVKQQRMF